MALTGAKGWRFASRKTWKESLGFPSLSFSLRFVSVPLVAVSSSLHRSMFSGSWRACRSRARRGLENSVRKGAMTGRHRATRSLYLELRTVLPSQKHDDVPVIQTRRCRTKPASTASALSQRALLHPPQVQQPVHAPFSLRLRQVLEQELGRVLGSPLLGVGTEEGVEDGGEAETGLGEKALECERV